MTIRSETTHCQGSDEYDSWHSVGHLCAQGVRGENCSEAGRAYLVQVPGARGRVIPDMASIRDDFPALCDPKTAMTGMSRSSCALREKINLEMIGQRGPLLSSPCFAKAIHRIKHLALLGDVIQVGKAHRDNCAVILRAE